MHYLIVLDAKSATGHCFLQGSNDGVSSAGNPAIACDELDNNHATYLLVHRPASGRNDGPQTLQIPHTAVAYVIEYAPEAPQPFGFCES